MKPVARECARAGRHVVRLFRHGVVAPGAVARTVAPSSGVARLGVVALGVVEWAAFTSAISPLGRCGALASVRGVAAADNCGWRRASVEVLRAGEQLRHFRAGDPRSEARDGGRELSRRGRGPNADGGRTGAGVRGHGGEGIGARAAVAPAPAPDLARMKEGRLAGISGPWEWEQTGTGAGGAGAGAG